ncbi:hypothetical protein FB451DRAFT_1180499 [Mycena latifolia]|nr:hypothetical protein FB451DRAFT_1180499 [Mycena latifolia]
MLHTCALFLALHLAQLSAPPPAPRSALTALSPARTRAPVAYTPDPRASRLLRLPQTSSAAVCVHLARMYAACTSHGRPRARPAPRVPEAQPARPYTRLPLTRMRLTQVYSRTPLAREYTSLLIFYTHLPLRLRLPSLYGCTSGGFVEPRHLYGRLYLRLARLRFAAVTVRAAVPRTTPSHSSTACLPASPMPLHSGAQYLRRATSRRCRAFWAYVSRTRGVPRGTEAAAPLRRYRALNEGAGARSGASERQKRREAHRSRSGWITETQIPGTIKDVRGARKNHLLEPLGAKNGLPAGARYDIPDEMPLTNHGNPLSYKIYRQQITSKRPTSEPPSAMEFSEYTNKSHDPLPIHAIGYSSSQLTYCWLPPNIGQLGAAAFVA